MNDGVLTGHFGRTSLDAPPWMEQWPTVAPRPDGVWSASGGGSWATLLPETGEISEADPSRDHKLPGLAAALEYGRLIAYRPSRRAVVAVDGGNQFIKVVRPSHLDQLLHAHRAVECLPGVRTPTVLDATADGRVTLSKVDGPRLHDVLARRLPTADVDAGIDVDVEELAELLQLLNGASVEDDGTGSEVGSTLPAARLDDPTRWISIVARFDLAGAELLQAVAVTLPDHRQLPHHAADIEHVGRGAAAPAPVGLVHGDLHDKNIMLPTGDGDDRYGIIDFDGLTIGPPELDVANLGVHLGLRVLQVGGSLQSARQAAASLIIASARTPASQRHRSVDVSAQHPPGFDVRVAEAVARHTAFRLACLYWCRRDGRQHVAALATLALHGVLSDQLDVVTA